MCFLVPYVDGKVIVEQDYKTRLNSIIAEASISLSIMAELVKVSGSAKYLDEKELLENQASVTLTYVSKTIQQKLPTNTVVFNTFLCDELESNGATHYVSEVTFGLNAYLKFTADVR